MSFEDLFKDCVPETIKPKTWEQMRKDLDEMAIKIAELENKLEIVRLHTSYRTSDDD